MHGELLHSVFYCAQRDPVKHSRANIFLLDTISFKDKQVLVSIFSDLPVKPEQSGSNQNTLEQLRDGNELAGIYFTFYLHLTLCLQPE